MTFDEWWEELKKKANVYRHVLADKNSYIDNFKQGLLPEEVLDEEMDREIYETNTFVTNIDNFGDFDVYG